MGWYGTWNLEYTGKNNEKFVNTAKLVIANFKKRFEVSDDDSELEAIKGLSWYSADMDIERIMSYLEDGDSIHVLIDGETHPYDDNDEELEWEEQTYTKADGQVTMQCEYTDCDRYQSDRHGMRGAFLYELAYPERAREETIEGGYTDTLDTYLEWIAGEMGDSEEMMPIIQDFLSDIMSITPDEVKEENGKIDEEAFSYFNRIKEKFATVESTKAFLGELREKLPPKEKTPTLEVPELFANMNKNDIKKLGGMEVLIQLYEKQGYEQTKQLLTILGYDLNAGNKAKGKKQSSVEKRKAENEVNEKIKQSVTDYFLGCIRKKYPNLTEENAKRFSESLGEIINDELDGGGFFGFRGFNRGLNIDYEPSQDLRAAFYSMDMSNFDSGLPEYNVFPMKTRNVFPMKTRIFMEKGKYAEVRSEFGESSLLYMTDEYRQERLTSVNTKILQEESKIPQEVKDGFEQAYDTLIEKLAIQREPLVKKQEAMQKILHEEKALQEKAQQLLDSYASRIDELETLGLSETEKEQRKQAIIQEVKDAQTQSHSNRISEQLGELQEKYGYQDLTRFDEMHKDELDKQAWMREQYIQYAKQENDRILKKYRKEHPDSYDWPDTSSVPSPDLDRFYAEKDQIAEYDKKHAEKEQAETAQEDIKLSEQQQEFASALGKAYAEYMKEHGDIDRYAFRNEREQILADGFSNYFAKHYENLTNPAFLVDFENGTMREIAKQNGFQSSFREYGLGYPLKVQFSHVTVEEELIYTKDSILDTAKIAYATSEAIQTKINHLNSRIRFMQDTGKDSFSTRSFERLRDSFENYQRELQGKPPIEPSLEELDHQKFTLEGLDSRVQDLLQLHEKTNSREDGKSTETDEIEFDD